MKKREKIKFLRRAAEIALQSGCLRAKRGAVLVKNGQIVSEAFNQIYPSNDYCQKHGCLRDQLGLYLGREPEKCRSIHAEAAAIAKAARRGHSLAGASAFITAAPCLNCAKLIIAAGIKEVYYLDKYSQTVGERLLRKMGIKCQRLKVPGDDPRQRLQDPRGQ